MYRHHILKLLRIGDQAIHDAQMMAILVWNIQTNTLSTYGDITMK